MKKVLLLMFAFTMIFGGVNAQKSKKDSTFVKLIVNGKFKFFRRFQADTTVFIRKEGHWYIQRNGEIMDTITFDAKKVDGEKKVETKVQVTVDKNGNKKIDTVKVVTVITPKEHQFHGHWSGLEFGLNTFMNKNGGMSLPDNAKFMELNTSKSWAFHWNIFTLDASIYKNNIGFVTGLGTNFNNYNFKEFFSFNADSAALRFDTSTTVNFEKNKLFVWYLTVPALIEFQIHKGQSNRTSFFFSFGAIGSLKLLSRQKQIFTNNKTYINTGDVYLAPFKVDATARLGNGTFQVFANYSLTSLFAKKKGPEIMPLTVGLGLMF